MSNNFKIREESEQLFPEFIKTGLSLRSVAEIFEMQKGSQRQKWPGVVEGLGELTKEKLLKPFDMEDEAWKYDKEDTDSMAEEFLGKEIDELGVLAERIIDEAMERLSQESGKDSFPVSEWAKHLVASPVDNPIGDENPDKYYPAVKRAAEILTVAAFDDMSDLKGHLKFMYAAGGLELQSDVNEIVRDLAYEVFERAKESINPLADANGRKMRKELGRNILSPAIRNQIADARKQAMRELAKNNPALLKLFDEMDRKAKEGQ